MIRCVVSICLGVLAMSIPLRADARAVQFVVAVPDADEQQPDRIFLACSRDGWRADGREIPRIGPGLYSASLEFEPGLTVEYKFTREGTWDTVEKSDDGHDIGNRSVFVDADLREQVVLHRVASWANRTQQIRRQVSISGQALPPPQALRHTLTGDIRYHYRFHSPQLKNDRTVLVYLPPGYDDRPKDRYPVLYMHDGNNVFDAATAFGGIEWEADETAERLIAAGEIPPLIIVGIYNNADRLREYTPHADAKLGGGNGPAYVQFITETLKPFIDRTYRTRPDRENTAICGSSLGGLISLYAVHARADVFGKGGIVSPALWFADAKILEYVRKNNPRPTPRLWIDVGTSEGQSGDDIRSRAYTSSVRQLGKLLVTKGYRLGEDFRLEVVEGARHHESAWAARFPDMLRFLFGKAGGR